MAKIRYRVKGKSSNTPVYLRFTAGRTHQYEVKSGYTIPTIEYFNNSTGLVRQIAKYKGKAELQQNLNNLKNFIESCLNNKVNYSKEWLLDRIKEHHGLSTNRDLTFLTDLIESHIEFLENDLEYDVTDSTIKSYKVTLFRVQEYEKHIERKLQVDEINKSFKNSFIRWCKIIQKYQPETYKKTIKQLRTICKDASLNLGVKIDSSFFIKEVRKTKSRQKAEKKDRIFPVLTFEDIDRIKKYQGKKYLENVRDWLVISCWTATRVSDLMRLNTSMISVNLEGDRCLSYTQFKTEIDVTIPIHPDIEEILERLGGFPKPISDQKYNKYIKELCKECGINEVIRGRKMNPQTNRLEEAEFEKWQLITSHIGRRSFSTNHYGEFTNHRLMLLTGHKSERQFLDYIGKRSDEHLTDFMNYWISLKKAKSGQEKIG